MSNNSQIPKPTFKNCDETSLTLGWNDFDTLDKQIRLQYKKYGEDWSVAKSIDVQKGSSEAILMDIVDLDPGTPYFVRLVLLQETEIVETGPETVFDTKPIDCTPKKKTCSIM